MVSPSRGTVLVPDAYDSIYFDLLVTRWHHACAPHVATIRGVSGQRRGRRNVAPSRPVPHGDAVEDDAERRGEPVVACLRRLGTGRRGALVRRLVEAHANRATAHLELVPVRCATRLW